MHAFAICRPSVPFRIRYDQKYMLLEVFSELP